MGEGILIQNIGQTASTIFNVDTSFYSNNIKPTEYNNILVIANVSVVTTGTSTLQNINIKLKLGANTLYTWVFKANQAAAGQIPLTLTYIANSATAGGLSVGGVLSLTASAAAADVNTNITGNSIYVVALDL